MPENRRRELDDPTVEQLLTARLAPDDAPPGYRAVAATLREVAALSPSTRADELISTMSEIAASQPSPTRRTRPMNAKHLSFRAVGAAFAAVAVSATAAAATTGSLPDAAEAGLANAASHAGITLPNPHSDHSDRSDRGDETSTDAPSGEAPAGDNAENGHGKDVSETARTTDATGRDKGQEISTVARDGHGTTPPAATDGGTAGHAGSGEHAQPWRFGHRGQRQQRWRKHERH